MPCSASFMTLSLILPVSIFFVVLLSDLGLIHWKNFLKFKTWDIKIYFLRSDSKVLLSQVFVFGVDVGFIRTHIGGNFCDAALGPWALTVATVFPRSFISCSFQSAALTHAHLRWFPIGSITAIASSKFHSIQINLHTTAKPLPYLMY